MQAIPLRNPERALPPPSELDPWLLGPAIAIACLGLVMMCSASTSLGEAGSGDPTHYLVRQLVALGLALTMAALTLRVPMATLKRLSGGLLLATFAFLALVLFDGIGREVNGARRWLDLGPVAVQVSEPAKLTVILYLAGYLTRHRQGVATEFAGFIKPIIVLTLLSALLLLEPDFGSMVVIFATGFGMLFLGGVPLVRFFAWTLVALAFLMTAAFSAPYRLARLTTFLDPWSDPLNHGFQLTQALIAFGRGEWLGVGLGRSVQKLFYLPEAHTDFVFAIVGEELGLMGTLTLIALFTLLVWRMLMIGARARAAGHLFSAHVACGVGLLLGFQAFFNMGVAMGVLPTKGLTLPFVSYGNNSLLVSTVAVALVARVAMELPLAPSAAADDDRDEPEAEAPELARSLSEVPAHG